MIDQTTMKSIALSLIATSSLALGASNAELEAELKSLKSEFKKFQTEQSATNEALIEEVANVSTGDNTSSSSVENPYESFSDLGVAASKVYKSNSVVSLGGYGEYRFKKYSDFKNYGSASANKNKNKAQTNITRFVPYIGFKFNDWIVMNTEIEFEDGGARSDGTKQYKYAIVEFSYLDFLFDEKYNLRVGHVLVPFGNINLNHEPTSFLTSDRPVVENFIIPSTWHTNGALMFGEMDKFNYYAGVITSPDASKFNYGKGTEQNDFYSNRYIQQGRLGARQNTDDVSFVVRLGYDVQPGLTVGTSLFHGNSTDDNTKADVSMSMVEAHASYKNNGFDIQALAVVGQLGGDYTKLNDANNRIASSVNGQYLTVGYDLLKNYKTSQKLYVVGEVERLDMDADAETHFVENNQFNEYTAGLAYFPDPKVVVKAEYNLRDYASGATLADEKAIAASIGFIF